MDKTQQELLKLLQCALWGKSCDAVSVEELRQVMELAKAHTVDGLVAGVFMNNKVRVKDSPELEDAMMNLAADNTVHKRTYAKHSSIIIELDNLLTGNNIHYFVFKGTAAAAHYPEPYQRTMGDVDFYVAPQDFQQAIEVIEGGWNVKITEQESEKHLSFEYKNIPFEMHHRVETFGLGRHQRLFDEWINNATEHTVTYELENGMAHCLPPEEDVLTVFKHMFNHLLVEGVGLRQVVDVAVLLNDYQKNINATALREKISKVGYLRAFNATVAMLDDYLGLPCSSFYSNLSGKDHKWGRKVMDFVMKSGNFGRSSYKNKAKGLAHSTETATHAFWHIFSLAPLLPSEVPGLILKHTGITIKKHLGN